MTKRLLRLTFAAALTAAFLFAGDISGTWTGTMSMGDNQFPLTYKFTQDGAKLSGSVTGPGGEIPLSDGKVAGDKISFTITFDRGGSQAKFVTEGTVKGEEIVLETKGDNFTSPAVTLKRAK